jgi:O-acetyl-ADP-ribose deacetylase (regulator of RNase III)
MIKANLGSKLSREASAAIELGAKVHVVRGSVIDYAGSAIVNAANEGCLGGGGVDGAISNAGGPLLAKAREALPIIGRGRKRCFTGGSKTTIGGSLPAKFVIHAVGPNYHVCNDEAEGDLLLYSAYRSAMLQARAHGLPDLAFSLLSAGIFRASKPLKDVLAIGLLAVSASAYPGLRDVHFVGFTPNEVGTLSALLAELFTGEGAEAAMAEHVGALAAPLKEMHAAALAESGLASSEPAVGLAVAAFAATAQPVAGHAGEGAREEPDATSESESW